jgi:tripartite-type tricarboxylate transporter receptor subunit TctC
MPVDIIQRLNRELQAVLQMPSFRERLLAQGADPTPGSADEFGRFLESEIERWRILIRQAGVTLN